MKDYKFLLVLLLVSCCLSSCANLAHEKPENNSFIFSAEDKNNPLRVFRIPIPKEILSLTEEILSKTDDKTPLGTVKALSLYNSGYVIGTPKIQKMQDWLTELGIQKVGACGEFSNLLAAMLAVRGIKSRIITLANYPENDGHVVIEVLINGRWVVFDPTYSSYFSIVKADGTEELLGFEELRSAKYNEKDISHTILNKERYIQGGKMAEQFAGLKIYKKANPAGVIGPSYPMYYPLFLDAQLKTNILTSKPNSRFNNQGAGLLGSTYDRNYNHKLVLSNLKVGNNYRIRIAIETGVVEKSLEKIKYFKAAAYKNKINTIPISTLQYDLKKNKFYFWDIKFTPQNTEETIFIKNFHVGDRVVYLRVYSISLIED